MRAPRFLLFFVVPFYRAVPVLQEEALMIRRIRVATLALLAAVAPAVAAPAFADDIPAANPYSGDAKAINSGKSWYRGVCAACHGGKADGAGERGNGADLRKYDRGFKQFVDTVLHGKQTAGRSQIMPGWKGVLDDKVIYEIGAYLETLGMDGSNWKEGVVRR
jgi:mono/diheme cytochrome c family protein